MKTSKQILKLLSSLNGLENNPSQQWNLNSLAFKHSFDEFLNRLSVCDASVLSESSGKVTQILNRTSLLYFILIMNKIDESHPGLSFYYVMQARSSQSIEEKFFTQRLQLLRQNNLLSEMFAPMRRKLINGLLAETAKSSSITNITEEITNNFNLPSKEIEVIKDILLLASYKNADLKLPTMSEIQLLSLLDSTLQSEDEEEDYDLEYDEDEYEEEDDEE